MKRIIIALAAIAAAFTMASCNKEDIAIETNGQAVIKAFTENTNTKTSLSGSDAAGYDVVWSTGDSFKIGEETFTLEDGDGTTNGTFTGNVPADGTYTVYYPSTYDGTEWPASQTYVESDIAGSPMKATVTVSNGEVPPISFKNEGGILRLTVKAADDVPAAVSIKSIVIQANELSAPVTLDCGDDVTIDSDVAADFHIAMPENEYTGVKIIITDVSGNIDMKTLKSDRSLVIDRSMITTASFSAFKTKTIADILPADFPAAEEGVSGPPTDAWGSIDLYKCYLSYGKSKLIFYNADGIFSVNTDTAVSLEGSNYSCIIESITITFTMSDGQLSNIKLKGEENSTWNGTYDSSGCIAAGTMITMSDGSQKAVELLEIGDVIRTVDHKTGEVSSSQVCFIWESKNAANAFTLTFEGGVEITVIEEHGFYDQEERQYAFINAKNASDFIGHHFYDADNGSWRELTGYKEYEGFVDAYSIATSKHLDHLSNGILSMSDGSFKILANLFEFDDQIKFDADKKQADIDTYGLTPIEKVLELEGFTEKDYYDYNLQYLDIAVGKGLTSWEWIKALSDYCVANGI